eukprot:TRINITY_DN3574_c0_g4_i2.p1 TRINITY_DN3574_c0_g4~~TRINITY_DN3574_c0_g4_i2.p1  ORF type:complete len:872 (+),score=200.57 TRINITY_DN3574_c0_g4_i2:71-2617(+)
MLQRCCQAWVGLALRESDTPEERERKAIWMPTFAVLFLMAVLNINQYWEAPPRVFFFSTTILGVAVVVGLGWPMATRTLSTRAIGVVSTLCVIGVIFADLGGLAANHRFRAWTWIVLTMDLYLALEVPWVWQATSLAITTAYLCVAHFEATFGLGLFHVDGFTNNPEAAAAPCACADPPCTGGTDELLVFLPATLIILYTDYFATRGFAGAVRQKQMRIVASVRVSERVANLLAAYATDDARRVVEEEGAALPAALHSSYSQLLANLDSYRVFLPDSLLSAARKQQEQQQQPVGDSFASATQWPLARAAPGLGLESATVAVCFTDIQSSTELWEAHPQGMYESLNIHNQVMRDTYAACHGYEVKTIGDSFMVTFDTSADAVRFGLGAQLGLLRQKWPEDVLEHPLCQRVLGPDGELLWGGLRVRIGVQCGPVRAENNPVTGRCDYFGHTVNTAARLEAVLRCGGLVAVSETVVSELGQGGLEELGTPVLHSVGPRELKGVKESVNVWVLVPQALRGRLEVLNTVPREPSAPYGRNAGDSGNLSITRAISEFSRDPLAASTMSSQQDSRHLGVRGAQRIALSLKESVASCAVARVPLRQIEPVPDRLPSFVAAACLAADQTQGVVEGVLSACVTVAWNAARPCADHSAACRHFLGSSFRAPCHLGATSGAVISGSISAGRRSFTTVAGGCVELAAALAEEAERCGDLALVIGAVAEGWAAAGGAFCAQLWEAPGHPVLVAWAVLPTEDDDKWQLEDPERVGGLWAAGPPELFYKACAASPGSAEQEKVLAELRAQAGTEDSGAAQRLAERIAAGGVRARPMPPLWEGEREFPPTGTARGSRVGITLHSC